VGKIICITLGALAGAVAGVAVYRAVTRPVLLRKQLRHHRRTLKVRHSHAARPTSTKKTRPTERERVAAVG
jgi:outer membrane lipoprotein SlyB